MKNPFNKASMKSGAITAAATTLGTLHFIVQGTADIIRETEVAIIHKIDDNADPAIIRRIRHKSYLKNKARIGIAYCQTMIKLEDAKDSLGNSIDKMKDKLVRKAAEVANDLPFTDGPGPMPQMSAEEAFDLANRA